MDFLAAMREERERLAQEELNAQAAARGGSDAALTSDFLSAMRQAREPQPIIPEGPVAPQNRSIEDVMAQATLDQGIVPTMMHGLGLWGSSMGQGLKRPFASEEDQQQMRVRRHLDNLMLQGMSAGRPVATGAGQMLGPAALGTALGSPTVIGRTLPGQVGGTFLGATGLSILDYNRAPSWLSAMGEGGVDALLPWILRGASHLIPSTTKGRAKRATGPEMTVEQVRAPAVAELEEAGYWVPPSAKTGSLRAERIEDRLQRSRPAGWDVFRERFEQNEVVSNQIANRALGEVEPYTRVPEDLRERARERIQKTLDDIILPTKLTYDMQFRKDLVSIGRRLDPETREMVPQGKKAKALLQEWFDKTKKRRSFSGKAFQEMEELLHETAKDSWSGKNVRRDLGRTATGIRQALLDMFERQMNPRDLARYREAKKQYATSRMLGIPGVVDASGNVNAAKVKTILDRNKKFADELRMGREVTGLDKIWRYANTVKHKQPGLPLAAGEGQRGDVVNEIAPWLRYIQHGLPARAYVNRGWSLGDPARSAPYGTLGAQIGIASGGGDTSQLLIDAMAEVSPKAAEKARAAGAVADRVFSWLSRPL